MPPMSIYYHGDLQIHQHEILQEGQQENQPACQHGGVLFYILCLMRTATMTMPLLCETTVV